MVAAFKSIQCKSGHGFYPCRKAFRINWALALRICTEVVVEIQADPLRTTRWTNDCYSGGCLSRVCLSGGYPIPGGEGPGRTVTAVTTGNRNRQYSCGL